jgi:hypothetical protein
MDKIAAEKSALVAEKNARMDKIAAEKSALVAEKNALIDKIAAEKSALVAEKNALMDKIAAEKSTLAAEKNTLAAEKNTLMAEKALVASQLEQATLDLARHEAVLQPRILMEAALRAKYLPSKGRFVATEAWNTFFQDHVLDTAQKILCGKAAALSRKLGCTENSTVLRDNLATLYGRASHLVHHRRFVGFRPGLYCGGDYTTLGCASAVAIKMLQDDEDVKKTGVLACDITYLDEKFNPKCVFKADNTVVDVVVDADLGSS